MALNQRIDLSTVPSSMETIAAGWSGGKPRAARKSEPKSPRPCHAPRRDYAQKSVAVDPAEKRARMDAMKAIVRDLPHPERYAASLPFVAVEALEKARKSYGAWRYSRDTLPDVMRWLRSAGLAYTSADDFCLTMYAVRVRKALEAAA